MFKQARLQSNVCLTGNGMPLLLLNAMWKRCAAREAWKSLVTTTNLLGRSEGGIACNCQCTWHKQLSKRQAAHHTAFLPSKTIGCSSTKVGSSLPSTSFLFASRT
eukprot:6207939-Pleurochrysis_carterae.AAC.2